MIRKLIIQRGLTEKEADDVLNWAFGKSYLHVLINKMIDMWNHQHGNDYVIYGRKDFLDSIDKIIELYEKENNNGIF